MFPNDLLDQLRLPHYVVTDLATPFRVVRLADTDLRLHLIDLTTYRQCHVATTFFRDLSAHVTAERRERIVHVWEDVWRQKPSVVASRLRAMAGQSVRIPARLTGVRRIDQPTARQFLTDNHLQVAPNAKFKLGLFLPRRYFRVLPGNVVANVVTDEWLVAVATFAPPRLITRNGRAGRSFELVRFASRVGCTVVGGLDKLLKAFAVEQQPADIMTYADRDWSDGRSYERLGFVRTGETEPQPFWLDSTTFERYYPHRLPPHVAPDRCLTVYNAGSLKFVKVFTADGPPPGGAPPAESPLRS